MNRILLNAQTEARNFFSYECETLSSVNQNRTSRFIDDLSAFCVCLVLHLIGENPKHCEMKSAVREFDNRQSWK